MCLRAHFFQDRVLKAKSVIIFLLLFQNLGVQWHIGATLSPIKSHHDLLSKQLNC